MPKTVLQVRDEVNREIFPAGVPSNLVAWNAKAYIEALIYLQRWIPCLHEHNVDLFDYCSTYFSCGATVIEKPRGHIERLYTLENDCCPVYYDYIKDYNDFLEWILKKRIAWTEPLNEDQPSLPNGFKFPEAAALDKPLGRNDYGVFTLHNDRIYIGHRIESTERVAIEWSGLRRTWRDDEIVPVDDAEFMRAIGLYVKSEFLRKFQCDVQAAAIERSAFNDAVAELIYECKRENLITKIEWPKSPVVVSGQCASDICAPPVESTQYFAIIGDWGDLENDDGEPAESVQSLVQGWDPEYIVTTGDNRYNDISYEDLFAALPYYGTFKDRGLMFPALGNHDTDDGGGLDEFKETFSYLPGNKQNYDIQLGHVHYFILEGHDTGSHAVTAARIAEQKAWLMIRLASSKAPWKVVIVQDPPYDSDANLANYPGHTAWQIDYAALGADIVISGDSHFYERLEVNDFPYIINGAGGADLASFNASPVAGSAVRFSGYGAIRGRATCDGIVFEFFNAAGELIDSFAMGQTLEEAIVAETVDSGTPPTIVQNITNVTNVISGSQVYTGGFTDPNGNVTAIEGSIYKSDPDLGGDGQLWVKETGTGNTGWI